MDNVINGAILDNFANLLSNVHQFPLVKTVSVSVHRIPYPKITFAYHLGHVLLDKFLFLKAA
ncbi:unnamed protein product [Onchocerca flexuosa]|uniref:Uncharacterized protein n=1 Tax=Onchocerca flexuosa TaxID=387005 RepID=A0A183I8K7_9BILA|nr:unnamed protein product [Onchocerca flexuosa]